MKIKKIQLEEIILLHDVLCKIGEDRAELGLISKSNLEFAIYHIRNYNSKEYFFLNLSLLVRNIGNLHPFIDGNKRTALFLCDVLLQKNGLFLDLNTREKEKFILSVAKGEMIEIKEIALFIERNSVKRN